jgi:hypothetical protein
MFTNSIAERFVLAGNAMVGVLGGPNYVSFLGTTGKSNPVSSGATYLGERDYNTGTTTASELLLFKGWNPAGPDRIRHFAPSHQFDTYTSTITTGGFDTIGNLASIPRLFINNTGQIGVGNNAPNATVHISGNASTAPSLLVYSANAQTANIAEFRTTTGTVLSHINTQGNFYANGKLLYGTDHFLTESTGLNTSTLTAFSNKCAATTGSLIGGTYMVLCYF